jgi:hypothetical protein
MDIHLKIVNTLLLLHGSFKSGHQGLELIAVGFSSTYIQSIPGLVLTAL